MRFPYIIRTSLIVLALFIICGLLYLAVIPGGNVSYTQNFNDENFFIRKITPPDRVEPINAGTQKIIGDPVYFNLRTPRRFEKATLEIRFKNNSDRPIIQVGVLADKTIWRYDLRPIENRTIDQIALAWDKIESEDTIFLQKDKKYNSIGDFLKNLPPAPEIAVFNYDLKNQFRLPEYVASRNSRELNAQLRGAYQFHTYVKNEDLNIQFELFDLNENLDPDPVDVNIYYNGTLISAYHLDDDGVKGEIAGKSAFRKITIKEVNLPEGAYKIEFRSNDDIVTDNIKTTQTKIAFINKIWLYGAGKESITLHTDSDQVGFMTTNPASRQNIQNGSTAVSLGETYKMVTVKTPTKQTKLVLEKDDVTLSGNKLFSFTADELFNPEYKKVDEWLDVNAEKIKYIIARYKIPVVEQGGWKVATVKLDISNAYRETLGILESGPSQYSFMFSVPGLITQNAQDENVEIDEIRVDLQGTSLWKKISNIL